MAQTQKHLLRILELELIHFLEVEEEKIIIESKRPSSEHLTVKP